MPVVFLLVLAVMGAVLKYTVLGRSIYAVGGNPVASNSAGIRVARVKIIAYTISGFLAALAGFLLASWQMAITSNQGSSYLLYAIAAPIIGGVSVLVGTVTSRGAGRCTAADGDPSWPRHCQCPFVLRRHDWRGDHFYRCRH